jgi:hypothetical protein
MSRRLRRLRQVRLTRTALYAVSAVSLLATGLVVAGALVRTGPSTQVLALLRRARVERVVLAPEPAPAAAAAAPSTPTPRAAPKLAPPPKPAAPPPATAAPAAPTTTATTPASTPVPSKVKHVFVIALTTPSYRAAFGRRSSMPYLSRVLRRKGDLLTGYQTLGATSLPDYLALISGQAPNFDTERGCATYAAFPPRAAPNKAGRVPGRGCVYPNTILTLGDQLDAHLGWKGYFEDLGAALPATQRNCQHPNSDALDTTLTPAAGNDYATSQNPFVYFHSLLDLGDCTKDDLPLTALPGGLRSPASTANLVYIAPGLCDDGSGAACPGATPAGPAAADAFLERWVRAVLSSRAYKRDGVLVIVLTSPDAQLGAGTAFNHPIRTGALVISRYARPGSTTPGRYNPYSVLRSIEDLFAVKPLAHAKSAKSFATVALPGAWAQAGA